MRPALCDSVMIIEDILDPADILPTYKATSKKQALMGLARHVSDRLQLDCREVFDALMAREKLGTTGVGKGVAIPHARLEGLSGITGVFARLDQPVAFDSVDDRPVDLMFLLMAPEECGVDHLKALAKVSRLLRDDNICTRLRATHDTAAIMALLSEPQSFAA